MLQNLMFCLIRVTSLSTGNNNKTKISGCSFSDEWPIHTLILIANKYEVICEPPK